MSASGRVTGRVTTRATARATSVVAAAVLAVPLWGVQPASAAALTEQASTGAYFSASGVPDTGTDAGKPPNVTAQADGVAPKNLAVAGGNGAEQKVSFLFFDLAELPLGGTITSAQVTVPLVPSDNQNVVVSAEPVKVRACPAGPEGFGGEDGESLTVAPARLCEQGMAPAKASADGKSYVFDITSIAATWGEMNDGLALTTAEGADSTPFQVVFAPAEKATLTYEATAPVEDTTSTGGGVSETPIDLGESSGGSGSTDLGGGFGGETVAVPDDGGFGAVESPVVSTGELPLDAPAALPAAEPEVAGNDVAPAIVPVAVRTESLSPTPGFFLGLLLLAAALALLSLIMGDPRLPQATTRPSRLSQSLSARQRGGQGGSLSSRPALD